MRVLKIAGLITLLVWMIFVTVELLWIQRTVDGVCMYSYQMLHAKLHEEIIFFCPRR